MCGFAMGCSVMIGDDCKHLNSEHCLAGYSFSHILALYCLQINASLSLLGLHRISYPAPAEIRPNFHIRSYLAPVGYGRRIWGRIWSSFDASASLCNWQEFIVLQIR